MSSFAEVVIPPSGSVPLLAKQQPVCEKTPPFDEFHAFTRAVVDVSEFRTFLSSVGTEVWDDETQEGNVRLVRPAHDAWGVKKIIFTFCDDFLQKVFDLPWSREERWLRHLRPIYDAVGIKEDRVVRCLLASMPPGMTIPVHHDTGYWVKKTHRLHVALESGNEVDFMVGPTVDSMKKVKPSWPLSIEVCSCYIHYYSVLFSYFVLSLYFLLFFLLS